jgi:hypothetical protein
MLVLQAVPAPGRDAFRLLRARIKEAPTRSGATAPPRKATRSANLKGT